MISVLKFEGAQFIYSKYQNFAIFWDQYKNRPKLYQCNNFWHEFLGQSKVVYIYPITLWSIKQQNWGHASQQQLFDNLTNFLLFSHLFLLFNYAYLLYIRSTLHRTIYQLSNQILTYICTYYWIRFNIQVPLDYHYWRCNSIVLVPYIWSNQSCGKTASR